MNRIEKPNLRKKFWEMMKERDGKIVHKAYKRNVKLKSGDIVQKEYWMKPTEMERTKIERVFTTLLNWYVDHYNAMCSSMPDGTYSEERTDTHPELVTTCKNVGKSAGCSDRTARSMISNLVDMGVIVKSFKGSKMGIGIRFSASFLWGASAEEITENALKTICPPSNNWKKFPHNNTFGKNSEKVNTKNADLCTNTVERSENRERDKQIAVSSGEKVAGEELKGSCGKKQAGGGPVPSYPQGYVFKSETIDLERDKKAIQEQKYDEWTELCRQSVMAFWQYSYSKLYSNRRYDKETVRIILRTIWTDVYGSFTHIRNSKELAIFQARQFAKIDRAAKWFDYHDEAYLPDPHSIVVKGKGYFDKLNTRGFAGLEAWMRAEEVKDKKLRADWMNPVEFKNRKTERLLMQARRDFEKWRVGAKARVEVAHFDGIGLQQYYGTVFYQLGTQAFTRYNELIINLQKRDFQPIPKKRGSTKLTNVEIVEVDSWMGSFDYYYK